MTATSIVAGYFPLDDCRYDLPKSWNQNGNADSLVKTGSGVLWGILCTAAAGTPTLAVYDGLTNAGTVMVPTFTPVAGTFYRMDGAFFGTGLFLEKTGTTVQVLAVFR